MRQLFQYKDTFNADISRWDVSSVTNMGYMFQQASAFDQAIGSWVTSNVTNMFAMFDGATAFNQDIKTSNRRWDTSKCTDMRFMFNDAAAFAQNLSTWCVLKITKEPTGFATDSEIVTTPAWGGCPCPCPDYETATTCIAFFHKYDKDQQRLIYRRQCN
jgi:surface protein